MSFEDIIKYGSFLLAILAAAKGIFEYSKAQKFKKIELVEKLIAEFENEKTSLARQLLDDFWFEDESGKAIKYNNLGHVLRFHRPEGVTDPIEQDVRESFDKLLDFFIKLQYLLYLKLITQKDLYYFEYYLNKALDNEAVIIYAEKYGYEKVKLLIRR